MFERFYIVVNGAVIWDRKNVVGREIFEMIVLDLNFFLKKNIQNISN